MRDKGFIHGVARIWSITESGRAALLGLDADEREKVRRLNEAIPGWRELRHDNGQAKFTERGMMVDPDGRRSIFDDVDE